MRHLSKWIGFAVILAACFAGSARAETKVVAYVPNWVDLKAFSKTIAYDKLTHINIAFENPASAAGDLSFDRKNQSLIDAARAAKVNILVSIGGGSASSDKTLQERYNTLMTEKNRAAFAAAIADYLDQHHFDGIDVDIEGPAIGKDYGAFIAELAPVLKKKNKLLTAALSRDYGGKKVPAETLQLFDFVNIMAYDGAGPWDPKSPGQHSSMAYARENVDYWLKRGLPKSSAVLGVPFYGYGFGKDFRKDEWAYKNIVLKFPGSENADQAGETIWYNGIPTIEAKTRYVLDSNLGGVMIWELSSDAPGEKSLLSAIHAAIAPKPATRP